MGFPLESWDAAFADIGMFIGADGGAGWWTAIAVVMMIGIIVAGNNSEQDKYNKHQYYVVSVTKRAVSNTALFLLSNLY